MVAVISRFQRVHLPSGERRPVSRSGGQQILSRFLSHARGLRRKEHGSFLIEAAIVLPLFFILLFGIFSYSLILFGRGNAICAANQAARYAALHSSTALAPSTTSSIKSVATAYLGSFTPANTVTVSTPSGNIVGGTVTVTVSITYAIGTAFYSGGSITVTGSAQRTISR